MLCDIRACRPPPKVPALGLEKVTRCVTCTAHARIHPNKSMSLRFNNEIAFSANQKGDRSTAVQAILICV
jgi:hypothetical protein